MHVPGIARGIWVKYKCFRMKKKWNFDGKRGKCKDMETSALTELEGGQINKTSGQGYGNQHILQQNLKWRADKKFERSTGRCQEWMTAINWGRCRK